jgi:hypothetical protein
VQSISAPSWFARQPRQGSAVHKSKFALRTWKWCPLGCVYDVRYRSSTTVPSQYHTHITLRLVPYL